MRNDRSVAGRGLDPDWLRGPEVMYGQYSMVGLCMTYSTLLVSPSTLEYKSEDW